MAITADIVSAVKVQFLKPIFEDDFAERGMTAWLTAVEFKDDCYKLFFDFSEFEAENDKYFQRSYFANRHTVKIVSDDGLYTAKEAGCYTPKYSVYFSCGDQTTRDDKAFAEAIQEYLREVQ